VSGLTFINEVTKAENSSGIAHKLNVIMQLLILLFSPDNDITNSHIQVS
jgi:hypothetical protein